jgi:hypothetical protein
MKMFILLYFFLEYVEELHIISLIKEGNQQIQHDPTPKLVLRLHLRLNI